jgi:hypothetical protein
MSIYRGPRSPELHWFEVEPQYKAEPQIVKREPSDRDRLAVCYHETGHGVIALNLGFKITEFWAKGGNGYCGYRDDSAPVTNWEKLIFFVAGEAAKQSFLSGEKLVRDCGTDVQEIDKLAPLVDPRDPERAKRKAEEAAHNLFLYNICAISALAEALYDRGSLTPAEIENVLSAFPAISRDPIPDYHPAPAPKPKRSAAAEIELHTTPYSMGYFRGHGSHTGTGHLEPFIRTYDLADGRVARFWALKPTTA